MSADQAIENFRTYLRIKTVQPKPDYDAAIEFLKLQAKQLDLTYHIYECVPGKPIFILSWIGSDPGLPSILLNSHIDVVPVFPDYWKYDPFEAVMDDQRNIYARGTQDMKSVGIQYIEAIRRLKATGSSFKRTIHLSFVPDEEIGGHDGMAEFVKTDNFKQLNIGFALDEGLASESEAFKVYYGERNAWWIEVTCRGKPGHGSMFIEDNAGEKLRRIINSFLQLRDSEEERKKSNNLTMGEVTSVNLTMVEGGVQSNVVPAELKARFDIRIPPTVNLKEFEDKLNKWRSEAGADVTYKFFQKGGVTYTTPTTDDNCYWKAFSNSINKMNLKTELEIFPAGTDSRYLREAGYPAIGFSPMNKTKCLLHDHNEHLNADVFLKGIDIYVHIIDSLANS